MEIISRLKNVATTIYFPLIDAADSKSWFTGTVWGSLTNAALQAIFDDGTPDQALALSGTPTESGTITGGWYLALTAVQINHDKIFIKLSADEIDPQGVLITTGAKVDLIGDKDSNSGKAMSLMGGKIVATKVDDDRTLSCKEIDDDTEEAINMTIDEDGNRTIN